jgi:replicative DNA helicase
MTRPDLDPDYATIGGILLDASQLDAVSEWLRPADFSRPLCGELFERMTTMRATATPIDPVTVLAELRRAGRVRPDGYPAVELVTMVQSVPAPAMTPYYARLVLEAATFRRVEQCGVRLTQVGRTGRGTPDEALERVTETWRELADTRERWQRASTPSAAVADPMPVRELDGRRRNGAAVARVR